jgi:hypothetical protein
LIVAMVGAVSSVLALGFLVWLNFYAPGIYIYGQPTPWVDVQTWARLNTPVQSRFITPPEKFNLQESDWRVHSERSSVATLSELLVAAFQPGYEVEWQSRFELVAPGALAHFTHSYFDNTRITKEAYYSLSAADLRAVACKLNAQYAVLEKPNERSLPLAYENAQFVIYDLTQNNCSP